MKIIRGLWVFAMLAVPLCAQDVKPQSSLHAVVGDITDSRSTHEFNSEYKIELKFTGDAAADATTVRQVRVTKAIDELGRDLVPQEKNDSFSHFSSSHFHGPLMAEGKLRNPSRNASVIKLVEGEVELFNPTPENGGILVIKDILKHPAEVVENPALKKYGIDVIYLTKESYEAKKKQMKEEPNSGGAIGDAFGQLFKGMFSGMMSSDSKNSIKLYIKDPDKRVVDFEFQDANGKELKSQGSWSMNEMHNLDLTAPPPADAQMLIHLATPQATQSFPFKLENVPLS